MPIAGRLSHRNVYLPPVCSSHPPPRLRNACHTIAPRDSRPALGSRSIRHDENRWAQADRSMQIVELRTGRRLLEIPPGDLLLPPTGQCYSPKNDSREIRIVSWRGHPVSVEQALSTAQRQFRRRPSAYAMTPTTNDHKFLAFLISISGAGKNDRVLDIACGNGSATMAFAERCGSATG